MIGSITFPFRPGGTFCFSVFNFLKNETFTTIPTKQRINEIKNSTMVDQYATGLATKVLYIHAQMIFGIFVVLYSKSLDYYHMIMISYLFNSVLTSI